MSPAASDPGQGDGNVRLLGDPEGLDLERKSSRMLRVSAPKEAFHSLVHSWFSRKFASGCAILFPLVVTFWLTKSFFEFFDNIFSPAYERFFNIQILGLGFLTSMVFVFGTGVFFSSWLGSWFLSLGEWIIKCLPLIKHIYSAAKQVSAAVNPDNEGTKAFQECVLVRHPRTESLAFAFITGRTTLQTRTSEVHLTTVYVPTNHVYIGDILLLEDRDIIRTTLTVREGIELIVSCGMTIPSALRSHFR